MCETSQMCVLLKLHRIVQVSAVATRLTARILGASVAIGVSGSGPFLRIVFNVALQNRVSCRQ